MVRHMGPSKEGAHLTRQLIDLYEQVVPGTSSTRSSPRSIRHLVGDTCADWLQVPRTPWDTVVKAVPHLLGVLETIEDRSPLGPGRWTASATSPPVSNSSSLTRGRVMHYAIPEQLKKDYGIPGTVPRTHRWTPPAATVSQ